MNVSSEKGSDTRVFAEHLEDLRRRILLCCGIWLVAALVFFWRGKDLMKIIARPLNGLVEQLVFITPTEVFAAHLRAAVLAAFVAVWVVRVLAVGLLIQVL